MEILNPRDVAENLDGWTGGDDFITKVFKFTDFAEAFGFKRLLTDNLYGQL